MKEYTIYLELFGKKLKTVISALSEDRAKERLKDKIIFHKIEEVRPKSKTVFDDLMKAAKDITGRNV